MGDFDSGRLKPFLHSYGLESVRVSMLAPGRFRLDHQDGVEEGRIVPQDSAVLRMKFTDYLANRQFRQTQRFHENLYAERIIPGEEKQAFYLTDFWQGNALEISPSSLKRAIANLSALHQAAEGFFSPEGFSRSEGFSSSEDFFHTDREDELQSASERYGRWLPAIVKAKNRFGVERVLGRNRSDRRQVDYDWLGKWEEQAARVVRVFEQSGYEDIANRWRKKREVAWNNYRFDHLMPLQNGRLATLQTADPVYDTKLYDLATLCIDLCEAGHASGVLDAVSEYSKKIPILPEEKRMMVAYAAFPHRALRRMERERKHAGGSDDNHWLANAERHYSAASDLLNKLDVRGG